MNRRTASRAPAVSILPQARKVGGRAGHQGTGRTLNRIQRWSPPDAFRSAITWHPRPVSRSTSPASADMETGLAAVVQDGPRKAGMKKPALRAQRRPVPSGPTERAPHLSVIFVLVARPVNPDGQQL